MDKGQKTIAALLAVSAVLLGVMPVACSETRPSPRQQQPARPKAEVTPVINEQSDAPARSATQDVPLVAVPEDVTYSIISRDIVPGSKRGLEVRLSRKVTEDVLRAIALDLKQQDSRQYRRTFITYYLPGMTPGAGAWASTHFDPELAVRILGPTVEAEGALASEAAPDDREILGRWIDNSPFVGGRITLFQRNDKLFIAQAFTDGSTMEQEVVERGSALGRRLDPVESNPAGDHWVIGRNGDLLIRDRQGPIATAKPLG